MSTTDTNVQQVIVNKLTQAEYDTATKSPTEFYAVTDAQIGTADIADGAVTAGKIDFSTFSLATGVEKVVGTWTDPISSETRPLYEQVFQTQHSTSSENVIWTPSGTVNPVMIFGWLYLSTSSFMVPFGSFSDSNTDATSRCFFDGISLKSQVGNNYRTANWYSRVAFYYTKASDSPIV